MDARNEIFRILSENKAQLVRSKKHHIFKLQNGRTFVTGITRTGERGWRNRLSHLRKLVGIVPPDKGASPSKRKLKTASRQRPRGGPLFADVRIEIPELRSLAKQLKEATNNSFTVRVKARPVDEIAADQRQDGRQS